MYWLEFVLVKKSIGQKVYWLENVLVKKSIGQKVYWLKWYWLKCVLVPEKPYGTIGEKKLFCL